MAEQTFEDILTGNEPTADDEVGTAPTEDVVVEETEGKTEVEDTPKVESEPKEEVEEAKEPWTKAAYMSEKRKRQELERKLAQQERKPLPDAIDDPDGFASSLREEMAMTAFGIKTELSQELMRELHDDYDEKEAAFMELAQDNPSLIQELQAASNPARFAYETATKHAELQQLKDVDGYKAKLRSELEAELRAEILGEKQAKEAKTEAKESALKPSLVQAGDSGHDTEVQEEFEDILGRDANHRKR